MDKREPLKDNKTSDYWQDSYYGDIDENDYIIAGKRLGIKRAINDDTLPDWWTCISPRNHNHYAEGTWADFVLLAKMILKKNEELLSNGSPTTVE